MTSIDGMSLDTPSFALTLSDALDAAAAESRLDRILEISGACPSLRFVRVRDDANDPSRMASAAGIAAGCGLGLVLESESVESIRAAAGVLEGRSPLLCTNGDVSGLGMPVAVRSEDPRSLPALAGRALEAGCPCVVLHPVATGMKRCLEATVEAARLSDLPVMCSAWSGEYALSLSTVAIMRGARLAVLDDLDPDACGILDSVASGFSDLGFDRRLGTPGGPTRRPG